MNVGELARKLNISSKELLEILPAVGFHVGQRAIKIDDRQAHKIIEKWSQLLAQYRAQLKAGEKKEEAVEVKAEIKAVALPPFIRVKEFAEKLRLPLSKVMAELMKNGVLSSMNEQIDYDTAAIIAHELGFEVSADQSIAAAAEKTTSDKLEGLLAEDDKTKLKSRAPVVVVMGHVDHGKTKLLDAIRKTDVVAGESGGITQHIGAYQVVRKGHPITFIDTPGHEAFTTMRSRGARVADIAILVIAADDSIQPQTKESIKIINSAGLPMIVAINKIDKPEANIEKVKQDLAALNLLPEDWGGKTICVPISAKAGAGIDDLLEMILLVAETEKEKIAANPEKPAVGTIIESHINRGEGPVATVLIQNGTLRRGDLAEVTDTFYGKVRAMKNYKGEEVDAAGPSMPVKIIGLKAAPSVGDVLQVVADVDKKKKVKKYQLVQQAVDYTRPQVKTEADPNSLNIILKADVLGSLEAIIASLVKLDNPGAPLRIIQKGLGNITEGDIDRAASSQAVILGFHVKPNQAADNLAREKKVEIKLYKIIYQLLDEIKARMEKMLVPEVIRTDYGRLKVLAIFYKEKNAMVLGGSVTKGKIMPNTKADVIRGKVRLGTGQITQVQMNKVNVNEVPQGKECGLKYEGKVIVEVGDVLEIYQEEVKIKKL
ncbi:MAG: translation initiation factor IF-2 [Candidatus Buchananbacteria bacterium RIFCSPHIGHO2_02_FULL_45_11b]|uniref:Translation initiation factor IF-2 n=3 Tax=Candidatus Buchananiibacteriota TaxID=1817903 RepID=A0A1G1Y765_9BACT|nr:MAG: translation initiation factor IF-2 [Candidatus Buchananbacteria bacterium RIFCSPHIGHO2_01_FULL_46_12]OGY51081.1 MAG: translation initiation factor IF-2 [Candidatus Buchananbacteria bacterium RIFCSPHIGHO2_02_FULL_45_11b]OGY53957.1 MAG: translation initiation factor IF-2 [Candidatus Buchananbacteria bacterium RIFCSPLOWO2_01_FULL_45_31]